MLKTIRTKTNYKTRVPIHSYTDNLLTLNCYVGVVCSPGSADSKQNVFIAAAVSVGLCLFLVVGIIKLVILCE